MGASAESDVDEDCKMNAEDLENNVLQLIQIFINRLSESDVESMRDLATHSECGLAVEDLCVQLVERNAKINQEEYSRVRTVATALDIDSSYWLGLKGIID